MLLVPICLNFRFQLAREHPFHVSALLVRQLLASEIVQGGVVDIRLFSLHCRK